MSQTDLFDRVTRAMSSLGAAHDREMRLHGSNTARYHILVAINDGGKTGITPSEVSTNTNRSPNAISPLLGDMAKDGLVRRRASTTDRRSHTLYITAKGKRVVRQLAQAHARFLSRMCNGSTPADEQAVAGLERMVKRVSA